MKSDTKKQIITKIFENMQISFGILLLILCCTILIVVSTFIQIDLTHFILPFDLFKGAKLSYNDFLYTYRIIPQIPIVLFVGAFLGRKYGITSVLLYIILGLFVIPVFAIGGGFKYVFEYGFGYILAYIPAVYFSASILKDGFSNKNIIKSIIIGVLIIHIIGTLYMLFLAGLKHEGKELITGWIYSQSGLKIIYDIFLSYITVFIAKYLRIIFWTVK